MYKHIRQRNARRAVALDDPDAGLSLGRDRGVVVKALPLVYACAGCPAGGYLSLAVGVSLEHRRLAEVSVLVGEACRGTVLADKARCRFPVLALEGCAESCALQWLREHGISPHRRYVLTDFLEPNANAIADRIAAGVVRPAGGLRKRAPR
jgi:uncharacterized metal-binding protein